MTVISTAPSPWPTGRDYTLQAGVKPSIQCIHCRLLDSHQLAATVPHGLLTVEYSGFFWWIVKAYSAEVQCPWG